MDALKLFFAIMFAVVMMQLHGAVERSESVAKETIIIKNLLIHLNSQAL